MPLLAQCGNFALEGLNIAMQGQKFIIFTLLGCTNDLIRRLEADASLRRCCGFGPTLPHRTTFNRFISRLADHTDLVEQAFVSITNQLREALPDLGKDIAIDSTTVRTHASPNRRPLADPEASWTAKNSAGAKEGGKEWRYGYKLHMVADANHGLPIAAHVTTAKRNDSPELPVGMDRAFAAFPWFRPSAVIADRGYDGSSNYAYVHARGGLPVILTRRFPGGGLYQGVYTKQGVPTCVGMVPMDYVRTDPERGHLYRCAGCHLASRKGVKHCADEVWEDPARNLRLVGYLQRQTPDWQQLYAKRQSVERVFKSLKQSRRLERHCVRGLRQVTLHCLMAVLTYQATALATLRRGDVGGVRWMVARVA